MLQMAWKNQYYFSEFLYTKYPNAYIIYVTIILYGYLTVFIIVHITFDFFVYISSYTDLQIDFCTKTVTLQEQYLVFAVVELMMPD